jgi:Ca2+-binding EF-hand superfamily protein
MNCVGCSRIWTPKRTHSVIREHILHTDNELRRMFEDMDTDGNGVLSREEFEEVYI